MSFHFHIVTPSFNQLGYLRRCVASVADQLAPEGGGHSAGGVRQDLNPKTSNLKHRLKEPISVHHHIQDAYSTDGTVEFLKEHQQAVSSELLAISQDEAETPNTQRLTPNTGVSDYTVSSASAPDNGMYEAINKGIAFVGTGHQASGIGNEDEEDTHRPSPNAQRLSRDSVLAWLNCDEQYLPGTLEFVGQYFEQHPEVDILYGDYLVVDPQGRPLAFRKGYAPRKAYIQASELYNLSCTLFFRGRVFDQLGGFDAAYKVVADEDFIVRALEAGFKASHVRRYFSVFTFTGDNLSESPAAAAEHAKLKSRYPKWIRRFRPLINAVRVIEKIVNRCYWQKFPLIYSIYVADDRDRREFSVVKATWRWPSQS